MARALLDELGRRGMSQAQFADVIGVSKQRISQVLAQGHAEMATLERWAGALGLHWEVNLQPPADPGPRVRASADHWVGTPRIPDRYPDDHLLRISEAAALTGRTYGTIYTWLRRGQFPAAIHLPNGSWLLPYREFMNWMTEPDGH